jgi:hypothetical protein
MNNLKRVQRKKKVEKQTCIVCGLSANGLFCRAHKDELQHMTRKVVRLWVVR